MESNKRDGFRIDDYFICFPEGDFIKEEEDGGLSIAVDIYSVSDNNDIVPVKPGSVPAELQTKIEAYLNKFLEDAIERELAEHKAEAE
jgi:hypothetical protein